jgi:hypothetical protein
MATCAFYDEGIWSRKQPRILLEEDLVFKSRRRREIRVAVIFSEMKLSSKRPE